MFKDVLANQLIERWQSPQKAVSAVAARSTRRTILISDTAVAVLSLLFALYLHTGSTGLSGVGWGGLAAAVCLFAVVFSVVGGIRGVSERLAHAVSLDGLITIVQHASLAVTAFWLVAGVTFGWGTVPTGAAVIAWAIIIAAIGSIRLAARLMSQSPLGFSPARTGIDAAPVVLIGAGSGAEIFIKSCTSWNRGGYSVVAAFDDRGRREGMAIHGVPVVTSTEQLEAIARRWAESGTPIQAVIVTKSPDAFSDGRLEAMVEWASQNACAVLQMPKVQALESDPHGLLEAEPLRIEDLLGRPTALPPTHGLGDFVDGQTVVVTGAGGSIGSELCRQIATHNPLRLVVVDDCEENLADVVADLSQRIDPTVVVPKLVSVRDKPEIDRVFQQVRPNLVFHAAALKHVPIVERQPLAGLQTNTLGSKYVADAARRAGATAVVMVSTDKAVNPTNVMGASKRTAELYAQAMDCLGSTRFITVRFGNVLGSSGSVVPLFERQIRDGGPLTVTHPEMVRYFMTIPEASQLVLHATTVALEDEAHRGHIHVLNMGEPVRISALARKMIMLRGFRPGIDMDIVYTGLRPGEKLYEELFRADERQIETRHASVLAATPPESGLDGIASIMDRLEQAIEQGDQATAMELVREAVPEASLNGPLRPARRSRNSPGAQIVPLSEARLLSKSALN